MRLLLLTADYPPDTWSGIGHAVARQARALAAAGADVHVLYRAPEGTTPAPPTPGPGEPTVHRLDRHRCPVDPAQFDRVHLHSLSLSELALEIRRRFGLPLIYTAHSLLWRELAESAKAPASTDSPEGAAWEQVQQLLLNVSDMVLFLSRDEHHAALQRLPSLSDRSSVIPNGIEPVARRTAYDPAGPLLFAGRFARSKGIDTLADIVPPVVARWHCPFVLAGGHGDAEGERAIARLQATVPDAMCRVLPWQPWPQMRALLQRARLLLVPSRYEPFGQTALEAMAHGIPVLAAAVGGLSEVVAPGSGGLLVRNPAPAAWVEQLGALLDNPNRLHALSQRGPTEAAARYDIKNIAHQLLDTYTNVRCTDPHLARFPFSPRSVRRT